MKTLASVSELPQTAIKLQVKQEQSWPIKIQEQNKRLTPKCSYTNLEPKLAA